jgi:PAS domain S-box-containing protein
LLLDERDRFERLLANLSAAFVNLSSAEVDAGIDDALRQTVEFLDVDRGGFGEVSEGDSAFRLTHSYAAPGFPPSATGILASQLPWYSAKGRRGEVMKLVPLPDALPAAAAAEKEYCARSGLKSQLTIPLKLGGTVQFAIECASFREYRPWADKEVQRLRLLGEVFVNAVVRRRADEQLRRRERRYRDLVESTRAVPWEADPHGDQMRYAAPQVVGLLGYPQEAWYRRGFWASRLHPADRGRVLRVVADTVYTGRDHEMEYRLVAADGRTVWVHDLLAVRAEDGRPITLRGVMIDISARKRAEEEAAGLREQLAKMSRVTTLGELAAAIAHEINQPLCAIVSNAETVRGYLTGNTVDVAEVDETLQDIVADGRRASEIIRRIRSLLRTRRAEQTPFDINEAVREVLALLNHRLMRDPITVATDLAADLPPAVGDRVQVQQVVMNLMMNAAEAVAGGRPDRRRITVSTVDADGDIAITVQDTGPGITADLRDRVFEAFFTTKSEGTGIGLSISRTIVEAHGGRLWVAPAPGGGAAFHFTLRPVARPAS